MLRYSYKQFELIRQIHFDLSYLSLTFGSMEKQTNTEIVYSNLVEPKNYAIMNGVNPKTVYDWIKAKKLPTVTLWNVLLVDKTFPAPKTYNLTKKNPLTAKHL